MKKMRITSHCGPSLELVNTNMNVENGNANVQKNQYKYVYEKNANYLPLQSVFVRLACGWIEAIRNGPNIKRESCQV